MRVEVSEQVANFVRSQAPEPRRALRMAIRKLEGGKGDIKALEPPLDGFCRLRAGGFRVIFAKRGVASDPAGNLRCTGS